MAQVEELLLKGLLLIEPKIFFDQRGYFFESFNSNAIFGNNSAIKFVQDNESLSDYGVLRGLHFQNPPHAQGKLIRVVTGAVLDVVVDIRKSSPTYMQHFSLELNDENKLMLYVPPGFAHGFISLKNATIFQYKCTNYWNKEAESGIAWNDPQLGINWKLNNPLLSEKDLRLPLLKATQNLFE